jgi:LEA14-like dessication related protein
MTRKAHSAAARGATAALIAGLLLAAGCRIRKPKVELENVRIDSVSLSGIKLGVAFTVQNPNDFGVGVYDFRYSVAAEGGALAEGRMPRPIPSITPHETTVYEGPVFVDYATFSRVIAALQEGRTVPCRVRCRATFSFVGLPLGVSFAKDVALPYVQNVQWSLREVRDAPDGGKGVAFVFEMTNPNKETMTVTTVIGEFYVGDERAAGVDAALSASLPGRQTTELVVPVVDVSEAARRRMRDKLPEFRGRFTMGPPKYLRKALPWLKGTK